jgi:hypothetical protein
MTLDTYSHVLIDEPAERLAQLRRGVLVVFQGPDLARRRQKALRRRAFSRSWRIPGSNR